MSLVPKQVVVHMPVTAEALGDAEGMRDLIAEAFDPSPEAHARFEARERDARRQREIERLPTPVALDLDGLLDRMGWSREYAQHLVQPYCTCGPDRDDGWYVCPHAEDLGLRP